MSTVPVVKRHGQHLPPHPEAQVLRVRRLDLKQQQLPSSPLKVHLVLVCQPDGSKCLILPVDGRTM